MIQNATTQQRSNAAEHAPLIGLATLMKMAFSGVDLAPLGQRLLERAISNPNDGDKLMDVSTILQLTGHHDIALATQAQALEIQRVYHLPAATGRDAIRLLAIMGPGDLMANTPLEFLLEGSDVALDMLYVVPGQPLPSSLPEHDLAFVAVGESDQNRPLLKQIENLLTDWPRPVLNRPEQIARLSRDGACALLKSAPGVVIPTSKRTDRQSLERIGRRELLISTILEECEFPIIIRPVGSHAGNGLVKLDHPDAIADYLQAMPEQEFYVTPFIDYRGPDGQFRKSRIAVIDARPFVCHMAISDHWMIHYMNAGMGESAVKRAEEARFMAGFDEDFARRHAEAFAAITARVGLDYYGIDCAETVDGQLLIFEIDTSMIVHAMDPVDVFPYKQPQMQKVFAAFREMLGNAMRRNQP
jgi:glutathione synthase/RimK-type ligase-like ATP-grasp enzyme